MPMVLSCIPCSFQACVNFSEDEEAKEEKPKKREESTMNGNLGEEDLPPQVAAK